MSTLLTKRRSAAIDMIRAWQLVIVSFLLAVLVYLLAPQQMGIVAYKALLVTVGAFAGYWIDRLLSPYARPNTPGVNDILATARRAAIVCACILGVCWAA